MGAKALATTRIILEARCQGPKGRRGEVYLARNRDS